jgi:hypothetical protein
MSLKVPLLSLENYVPAMDVVSALCVAMFDILPWCLQTISWHYVEGDLIPGVDQVSLGIRTHDLSRRAAADLRLRPRDH